MLASALLAATGSSGAMPRHAAASTSSVACRVIDYTRIFRKSGGFDYTAVIRLANHLDHRSKVVGRWSVEGRRLVIRAGRKLKPHQARTVTRSVGHYDRHPTLNLLSCHRATPVPRHRSVP
jgi:hypothetical protein